MSWGSVTTSDTLNLTGSFQDFEVSSVTYAETLNPGERAHVQLEYDPQASPTEHLEWALYATPDGTSYDATPLHVGSVDKDLADPNAISLIVEGVYGFKVAGRLVDPDGTDGGDDTASAVLRVRKDGVNL
jgi:hypothetical protein